MQWIPLLSKHEKCCEHHAGRRIWPSSGTFVASINCDYLFKIEKNVTIFVIRLSARFLVFLWTRPGREEDTNRFHFRSSALLCRTETARETNDSPMKTNFLFLLLGLGFGDHSKKNRGRKYLHGSRWVPSKITLWIFLSEIVRTAQISPKMSAQNYEIRKLNYENFCRLSFLVHAFNCQEKSCNFAHERLLFARWPVVVLCLGSHQTGRHV